MTGHDSTLQLACRWWGRARTRFFLTPGSSHSPLAFSLSVCTFAPLGFLPNSDLLVGVEHNSDGVTHGSWWEVFGELDANDAALAVGGGDLAPNALVVDTSLGVLGSVNVGNALAVVPSACLTVLDVAEGDEGGVLFLGSLSSLEAEENALSVQSARNGETRQLLDYLWAE